MWREKENHFAQTWLNEHGDILYRYACLQLRDDFLVEEVIQDTFVSAIESWDRYQGNASVRTWLISILKNKIIDHFRKSKKQQQLFPENELAHEQQRSFFDGHWTQKIIDWGSPDILFENKQFWEILQQCIDTLPEKSKQIYLMREIMEEKTEKICQEFALSPTNLWTVLYRSRLKLRNCFEQHWEQD